jgi:hypothetical protein
MTRTTFFCLGERQKRRPVRGKQLTRNESHLHGVNCRVFKMATWFLISTGSTPYLLVETKTFLKII